MAKTLGGLNRRISIRNRRYKCKSEHHLAQKRPWPEVPRSEIGSALSGGGEVRRPSYPAFSMVAPATAQYPCEQAISRDAISRGARLHVGKPREGETSGEGEQAFSPTINVGGLSALAESDSVVVLFAVVA